MDFYGLARRDLQALCKHNKIPANMTNAAMADALMSLDNVEGVEEIMQPHLPGNEYSLSPEVVRTVTRTSTRARKPPAKVLESDGIVSHSRTRTSRKLMDDADDVSIKDEMDVAETPAVAASKKLAPAAAASRKKAEMTSVQRVYSTRRSVRLVEKQFSELCLSENKMRTQPIKIETELSSEITESVVKGDSFAFGSYEIYTKEVIDEEVNSNEELVAVNSSETLRAIEDDTVKAPGSKTSGAMDKSSHQSPDLVKYATEVIETQRHALEQTTDLLVVPETENADKENFVKDSKKSLEGFSMSELKKMVKGMKISGTSKKVKEGDTNKHQQEETPRQALLNLSSNTQS